MAPCFPYIQNTVFAFIYIISFYLIRLPSNLPFGSVPSTEIIGLCIFVGVNLVYSMLLAKDVLTSSVTSMKSSHIIRYAIMIIAIAFSITSSILLLLTMLKLQSTFSAGNKQILLGNHERNFLTNIEIIFITLLSLMTVLSFYIYYEPDTVYNTMYETLTFIYHNWFSHMLRILLPFLCLGVGSALYDTIVTRRGATGCGNDDDPLINQFRTNFVNTFWLLFSVIGLFIFRYLMEAFGFPYIRSKTGWVFINPPTIFIPTWEYLKSWMVAPNFSGMQSSGKPTSLMAKVLSGSIFIFIMVFFAIAVSK